MTKNIRTREKSQSAFDKAVRLMPGGVNSPVRAFRSVGQHPVFAKSGRGAYLTDIDGNEYIDYLLSWGPLLFGHASKEVQAAVQEALVSGTSFGLPTERESEMAELVQQLVPSMEVVRMVNSGTEATMSALRLARAFTSRRYIVKFEGGYHGHADALLVKAGSGVATLGLPDSPGVNEDTAKATLTVPYNDLDACRRLFAEYGEQIAAVIVEPVAGNMGCIPPVAGFLQGLRDCTLQSGALLIFDEVMTGFRVAKGGGQERFQVRPDLTTLGKVIGGGLPVGAYGGRADIMQMVAPSGAVYQAGTLSGNPLAMAAGYAALTRIQQEASLGLYERLEQYGQSLVQAFVESGQRRGIEVSGTAVGGMFGFFFHEGPVSNYQQAASSHRERYSEFFAGMLQRGVLLPPSPLESFFLSSEHGPRELEETVEAIRGAFESLR
ncbi:glutamate-1-semialdehyde 2,1-aminomutase [Alicyclobacillus sp. SP_1]|jgi:glutamate-1-semialdehyde 2,1-aminomutase|uniref:glutamate-1-semialdehyde 2,1-aminomutase n=1 Tax=Alicyclobacillus sp. SP_1 TaxID=2942475 RepID=UPI002158391E|nr:glutamate-1-semialdehyde 2,1-aminomutase [Alicyclobacillus sp. SP_1]